MPKEYGTPVEDRKQIQAGRLELANRLVKIRDTHADQQVRLIASNLFDRLVSDVDNEMLGISRDRGLPFLSYAKQPSHRWDSVKRMFVNLPWFLHTRFDLDRDSVQVRTFIDALTGAAEAAPAAAKQEDYNYPK